MTSENASTWENKTLADLADYINGRAFKPSDWTEDGLPIIRIAQMTDPTAVPNRYSGPVEHKHLVSDGDLLFSWSATLTTVRWSGGPAILNQHIFRVVEKPGVDRGYLRHLIEKSIPELSEHSHGSTMKHIRKGVLSEFYVSVPPLPEQRKIAAILSSVDEAIEKTQAVIDQVQVVKKGLMAELLTKGLPGRHEKFKQTEIGTIPESWDVVELQDLCSHIVDCLHKTPIYVDDGVPAIRTADVVPGRILIHSALRVSAETWQERTGRLVPEAGDIVYSREGERFGIAAPVPPGVQLCLSQRMMHFRAHDIVDPAYLMWLLNSPHVYGLALQDVGGSTSPHVNIKSIKRFKVPRPPTDEQREIGGAISSCLDYETSLASQVGGLRTLKSALMQSLLTGQIRVTP